MWKVPPGSARREATSLTPQLRSRRALNRGSAALLLVGALLGVAGRWSLPALAAGREPEPEARQAPGVDAETQRAVRDALAKPASCTRTWRAMKADGAVVQIDIHDVIDPGMAAYVVRSLEEAAARPEVSLVLLHMNTPGGRVDSAQVIKDALLRSPVPTATFIDSHALSAGALVAYATDVIVVSTGATMGAATPILVGDDGAPTPTGEKFVSAVRGLFRATAEAKGRDPRLAEAMVDAQVDLPALKPNGKLVTLTHDELLAWCVADLSADSVADTITRLGLSPQRLEHREISWAETLTRWLTDPAISSVLMSLGILGIMIELKTPGFGFGGALAITAFALFFGGHLFAHLAGLGDVVLLIAGVVLLGIEVAVPGHIVPGVLGIFAILGALGLAMVGNDVSMAWDIGQVQSAIWRTTGALTVTFAVFLFLLRWLPHNRAMSRLVLAEAIRDGSHDGSASVPVGAQGVAVTKILGSGKARFEGALVDVVSTSADIEAGQPLVVTQSRPGRIEVAPTPTPQSPGGAHESARDPDTAASDTAGEPERNEPT